MIILLSPSKTINFKPTADGLTYTKPQFIEQSTELAAAITNLGPKLAQVFGVSDAIAKENQKRFQLWRPNPRTDNACPAAWAYRGETYAGLSIETLDEQSLRFSQTHLYIISGLYGLLRPLDIITPYRLEI